MTGVFVVFLWFLHEMENRLEPFVPARDLGFIAWRAEDVGVDVGDLHAEYGFGAGSKQHNFLTRADSADHVVVLLHDGHMPRHMADPSVVARAFGVLRTGPRGSNHLELWHVSVRKEHPLNDSRGGTRWGVFGIARTTAGSRVRWRSLDGRGVTRRNAARHIRGTPNPYAAECLVRFAKLFECTTVTQNPEMPCAQLFDSQYCHRTHPATHVLFRALGFVQPSALDHYVWDAEVHPSLTDAWTTALEHMAQGRAVVA